MQEAAFAPHCECNRVAAASLILAAFQTSVEEDEGSHRLDLSTGEQRPRSAHVHGGRRKERKCEAEASRPHVGFVGGGGRLFTVFAATSRWRFCLTVRHDFTAGRTRRGAPCREQHKCAIDMFAATGVVLDTKPSNTQLVFFNGRLLAFRVNKLASFV